MPNALRTQPALEWASTVTPRHYAKHRAELDALILATVPSYQASVAARLDEFASGVSASRQAYDERHSAPQFIRPWRLRWAQRALFWAFFVGIITSFGMMYPIGGRAIGPINFSALDWALLVKLSSWSFVFGVLAQLARRLPVIPGIPPRKDLAWLPTAFGIPTIVMMVVNLNIRDDVEPGWIVLTGVALLVSIAYCLTRLVQRRRDPTLTRQVDSSEKIRLRAAADSLKERADESADLIEADFNALEPGDKRRLLEQYEAATEQLQRRGLIRVISAQERKQVARGELRRRRPMVPGFLLLERRVQELWDPYFSEPGSGMGVTWHAYQYLPVRKR